MTTAELGQHLTPDNFQSRDFWRNWEGYDYAARRFEVTPVEAWHPAFGTLSILTRRSMRVVFTQQQIDHMQFVAYLARRYELNEGVR